MFKRKFPWAVISTASFPHSEAISSKDGPSPAEQFIATYGVRRVEAATVLQPSDIDFVWHYTTFQNLMKIIASGVLLPSTANVPMDEIPVAWFTASPTYDLSALKIRIKDWKRDGPKALEKQLRKYGAARLGIDKRKTLAWDDLCKAAKISARMQALMSRPPMNARNFYGIPDSIGLDQIDVIEIMRDDGSWVRAEGWRPA